MANTNCLDGMKCPECGSDEPFRIASQCWAMVFDSGVEDTSDLEWNDNDACQCPLCGYMGKVKDFRNN